MYGWLLAFMWQYRVSGRCLSAYLGISANQWRIFMNGRGGGFSRAQKLAIASYPKFGIKMPEITVNLFFPRPFGPYTIPRPRVKRFCP